MPDPPTTYTANSDRTARANYALTGERDLTIGGRGQNYVFTDAYYSSRILRVTDGTSTSPEYTDRSFLNPSSAESPAWNSDSTKFYVMDNGGGCYLFNFDATGFQVSRMGNTSNSKKGLHLIGASSTEPAWSYQNANYLYSHFLWKIRRFDMTTVTGSTDVPPFTEPIDMEVIYAAVDGGTLTGSLGRLQLSDTSPELIVCPFGGIQDTWRYLLWYNLGTGAYKVLDTDGPTGFVRWYDSGTTNWTNTAYVDGWRMHNSRVDKTGRYVIPTRTSTGIPAGEGILEVWDTTSNTLVNIANADRPGGHTVLAYGKMINLNEDDSGGAIPYDSVQWWIRDLATPASESRLVIPNLVEGGAGSFTGWDDDHTSWHNSRADSLRPVISCLYRPTYEPGTTGFGGGPNPWRAWDGELVAIRTDGIESRVWRFARHQSITWTTGGLDYDFGDLPIPQVSQDGQYAYFSSNWGRTLGTDSLDTSRPRKDVFIVELLGSVTPWSATVRGKLSMRVL